MTQLPERPPHPTLPALLRRASERFGDDDYVVLPARRISFIEADQASAALAKELLQAGAGKGTRIGISMPTGVDWVLAWLAAARIGAMPMLFPATYRAAELRRALRISDTAILLASSTMLGKDHAATLEAAVPSLADHRTGPLRDHEVPYLRSIWVLDGSDRPWATALDPRAASTVASVDDDLLAAVESEVSPADPLLVIYTSGSTADPKAIVHTHGAAIRKVQPELGICMPGSFPGRTFCAMPFFWVGGPQNLLGALCSGAAVVSQERFDAEEALDLLERERCTSILGWASVYEQLRAHPSYASRDLGSLVMGLGPPLISSKGDSLNFGMTETFGPHANPEWFDYKVVDPEMGEPVTDGDEGEFCVRGFGLMAGMYKKEREQVFDSDGWYHTGDRGYLESGRIWFTGRYSEMIKSGGANVAPPEVEQALNAVEGVHMAFVFGVPAPGGGEVVAAAVIADDGVRLGPDDLRSRLNKELSAYKVPVRWLVLEPEEVPWLASGKPDKRALRERLGTPAPPAPLRP